MLTDPQPKPKKTKGFFDAFSSKSAFIAGLVIGILILCTIGFFILLTDNNPFSTSKEVTNQNQNSNVNQPTEPGNQPSAANLKMITSKDHVRGDISNAPVVLIEFSDYQCPYCANVHPTLEKLVNDYQGQVAWVYKHFPLDQRHPYARIAAEAAECASDQGKFWEYSDELYRNQQLITPEYLPQLAANLNLSTDTFNECLDSGKYSQRVNDNFQEAISVGVTGTPGIYVNDQLIKGALPYDSFKQIIDSILAE